MFWSYLLSAVGVFGLYLAGKKNPMGWAIGVAAQVLWVIYATVTDQFGFYIASAAYGTVFARNWWLLRKDLNSDKMVVEEKPVETMSPSELFANQGEIRQEAVQEVMELLDSLDGPPNIDNGDDIKL